MSSYQQRLVHRHKFELPTIKDSVEELSVDGGKIRLITPKGEKCIWRDYKGIPPVNYPLMDSERMYQLTAIAL